MDKTIVSLTQIETSNYKVIDMWTYADGELKEIMFDSNTSLGVSSDYVKFIVKNNHAQTFSYLMVWGTPKKELGGLLRHGNGIR